jgi:chromate transporter
MSDPLTASDSDRIGQPSPPSPGKAPGSHERADAALEVFLAFLMLGLTSFGGPVAHIGYFRTEFVTRRRWLSEADYADLVALCQFLPGPASSQVGMAIGRLRAGYGGALAAFAGFTLPSVLVLLVFAWGVALWSGPLGQGVLMGLKIAALAVVAQAVWQMSRSIAGNRLQVLTALVVAIGVLVVPSNLAQVALIVVAAVLGAALTRTGDDDDTEVDRPNLPAIPHRQALLWFAAFLAILVVLPLLAGWTGNSVLTVADKFYRTGALVFGGGHVVLPLLEAELVTPGLIESDVFLAGYGAAQAIPGPLFSFAAFAGAMLTGFPNGLLGAALGLGFIYLPSFLLVFAALPYWQTLRHQPRLRGALDMANAAVIGLLLAALYDPVFTGAVTQPMHFALAIAGYALLTVVRLPPWLMVALTALAGAALHASGLA